MLVVFQTPFGITACESRYMKYSSWQIHCFKRLSASLHVKVVDPCKWGHADPKVSNAFRHHCM